jgi:hypothetical protein
MENPPSPAPIVPARDRGEASPGTPRLRARRRDLRVPALALSSALLVAGCGGDTASQPATVEQLAAAAGCAPKITMEVDDYRQGQCKTPQGQFVFLSFATDEGKRKWLDYSQMFGAIYLVGNRWVLSSKPREAMEPLREKLGGNIEDPASMDTSQDKKGQGDDPDRGR